MLSVAQERSNMEKIYEDKREPWLQIYKDLDGAPLYDPRGQVTKEIEDYQIVFDPYERLPNFAERKLSMRYLCGELLWYLGGNRDDESILRYSKFWEHIKNEKSPTWNSNYGYYIFKEGQFDYVFNTLKDDPDSRQAAIVINRPEVMMSDTKDKICTYAISFRIRENQLNMSVSMRSNDYVYGTQIDMFQFSVIQEMLLTLLKVRYPKLEMGRYVHKADSFHIYQRHFAMMKDIIHNNEKGNTYEDIEIPRIKDVAEVLGLITGNYIDRPFTNFVLDHAYEE